MGEEMIKMIIKRYDTNNTGQLEIDQLRALMKDYNRDEKDPTEEQVQFVLRVADKSHTQAVSQEELSHALQVWGTYLDQKENLEARIRKFNADHDGCLQKKELHALLV